HAEMVAHSLERYGCADTGRLAAFTEQSMRALALAEALGRPASIGKALQCLGTALAHAAEHERGRELLLRSIDIAQQSNNAPLLLGSRVELIRFEASLHHRDAALEHIDAIVAIA